MMISKIITNPNTKYIVLGSILTYYEIKQQYKAYYCLLEDRTHYKTLYENLIKENELKEDKIRDYKDFIIYRSLSNEFDAFNKIQQPSETCNPINTKTIENTKIVDNDIDTHLGFTTKKE